MSENTSKKEEVKRTGHIYDEIEELDHPAPRWFTALFLITVVFGVIYGFHYTLGTGTTLTEDYEKAKQAEEFEQLVQSNAAGSLTLSETQLTALLKDDSKKKQGASIFQSKCASCHGAQGQGGIGPNLTDRYWIHGGQLTQILNSIAKGIPAKGMPPWEALLKPEEVQSLTVYIHTLKDTNPAGAKAPQGDLVKME